MKSVYKKKLLKNSRYITLECQNFVQYYNRFSPDTFGIEFKGIFTLSSLELEEIYVTSKIDMIRCFFEMMDECVDEENDMTTESIEKL